MPVQQEQSSVIGQQIKMGNEEPSNAKHKPKRCEIICYFLQHLISYSNFWHTFGATLRIRHVLTCVFSPSAVEKPEITKNQNLFLAPRIKNWTANTRKKTNAAVCLFILHFRRPSNQFRLTSSARQQWCVHKSWQSGLDQKSYIYYTAYNSNNNSIIL